MQQWTDKDYAVFDKDGKCFAISVVLEGAGAERSKREFYKQYAGYEIRIMSRADAVAALRAGMKREVTPC